MRVSSCVFLLLVAAIAVASAERSAADRRPLRSLEQLIEDSKSTPEHVGHFTYEELTKLREAGVRPNQKVENWLAPSTLTEEGHRVNAMRAQAGFQPLAQPVLTSVTRTQIPYSGWVVTIYGSNFLTVNNIHSAVVPGYNAPINGAYSDRIIVRWMNWPEDNNYKTGLTVYVTCNEFSPAVLPVTTVDYVAPSITSVSPSSWCWGGGYQRVTLTGTNFGDNPNYYSYVSASYAISTTIMSSSDTTLITHGMHYNNNGYDWTQRTLYLAWNNKNGQSGPYTTKANAGAFDATGSNCPCYPSSCNSCLPKCGPYDAGFALSSGRMSIEAYNATFTQLH